MINLKIETFLLSVLKYETQARILEIDIVRSVYVIEIEIRGHSQRAL